MVIYKTIGRCLNISSPRPDTVSWQASQTEASKQRTALKADGYKGESQTVNFPTGKGPILEWLNENVKV